MTRAALSPATCASTVLLLLLFAAVIAQVPSSGTFGSSTSCINEEAPRPCGSGASYAVAGVRSGITIDELRTISGDTATQINTAVGGDTALLATLTWTRIAFDVFFEDGLEAGGKCEFTERWSVTSLEKDTDQCSLSRCSESGSCFALEDAAAFELDVALSDFYYVVPFGEQRASMPFARMQRLRKKRGIDPNDDEEDGNVVHFSDEGDDSDDEESCSLNAGSYNADDGSADDIDGGSCMLKCDKDYPTTCEGLSTALERCYGGGGGGIMHALGHAYSVSSDVYTTYSPGGDHRGADTSITGCERRIDPSIAYGYVPSELIQLYEQGGLDASQPLTITVASGGSCNLAETTMTNACGIDPQPADWDNRIFGDDDEDAGANDDDSNGPDDDDDGDSSDTCRSGTGDNTQVRLEALAFGSGHALYVRKRRPLSYDLYTSLASQGFEDGEMVPFDGRIIKPTNVASRLYSVLSCGYCPGAQDNPAYNVRRFAHLDISPICDIYAIDATENLKPSWKAEVTFSKVADNPLSAPPATNTFVVNPLSDQTTVSEAEADSTLEAYGSALTVTLGDQVVNSSPSSALTDVDAAVLCYDSAKPWKGDQFISYPYDRFNDRCNGCTPTQESGLNAPKLWYTMDSETYGYLSNQCAPTYTDGDVVFSAGPTSYTGSGFIDSVVGTVSGDYNTDNGGLTWNMCVASYGNPEAGAVHPPNGATNCRPPQAPGQGDNGFVSEPAYGAAVFDDYYLTKGQDVRDGTISSADANSAFARSQGSFFTPAGFLVSPTVSTWVYFDEDKQAFMGTAPLSTRDAVGGSTLENPEASFRLDVYISSTVAKAGAPMLEVKDFSVSTGSGTDLCPLLFPDQDDGDLPACTQANAQGGVFTGLTFTELANVCGIAGISTTFVEPALTEDDGSTSEEAAVINYDFSDCYAKGLIPFCQSIADDETTCTSDYTGCQLMVDNHAVNTTFPSAEIDCLQEKSNVFFATSADLPVDCATECEVRLLQQFGDKFEIIATLLVPSCSTSGDTAGMAACNPKPEPSPTGTPTPTQTPTSTLSAGSSPSATPTHTVSPTGTPSGTRSPTTTPTVTPSPGSVPVEDGSQTRTPSARESPGGLNVPNSVSPFATGLPSGAAEQFGQYYNKTEFYWWYENLGDDPCSTWDFPCKCFSENRSWSECFLTVGGLSTWLVIGGIVVFVCCFCICICSAIVSKNSKKKKTAKQQQAATAAEAGELYSDFDLR